MKRNYLRMVRRTYRYLRHPRFRKIKWLEPLTKTIFHKRYWSPCRSTMANGLSIGLFCAMLPIPFQMLIAALGCIRAKGNVPIAIAACWITNPITQLPIMALQQQFGQWLHLSMGVPRPPLIDKLEKTFELPHIDFLGFHLTDGGMTTVNIGDFVLGFLTAAVALGILAYPIIWGISIFLPNRGKAVDSKAEPF